jgi:guanylate kinase
MSVPKLFSLLLLAVSGMFCNAFAPARHVVFHTSSSYKRPTLLAAGYAPPEPETKPGQKRKLHPNIGDIVRFYELDGGKSKGELLVGKISFIQKNLGREGSGWLVELKEMDDVGDGYYADYPARKRDSKKALRDLAEVSPVSASFVRSEGAFKVPRDPATGGPRVRAEQYDIGSYEGPFFEINETVLEADSILYDALKGRLLRFAALTGLAGTLIAELVRGPQDAIIYGAGSFASLVYLFLLSLKTDTVGAKESTLAKNVSSLRFAMPLLVLVGVALYDQGLGDASPVVNGGTFSLVSAEQFGAAILGFGTYRLPLFVIQMQYAFKGDSKDELILPGSAGVAMQLLSGGGEEEKAAEAMSESLATVLLVSGPQATGRSELVDRLIREGAGKFVTPKMVDRVADGATFERLERREELLQVDASGRFGMTKTGILETAKQAGSDSVVVIDASVALAKQLEKTSGLRLVGVWVGLNSVSEFEKRLGSDIDRGQIVIPEDETKESVMRARVKEIVQEIEYGISSGIFEFTVLNENEENSLKQLREAAAYCFK